MKSNFKEIWLCDVCRRWFPTEQIRKVPHDALQMAGANYLNYSEFHDNGPWYLKGGCSFSGPLSMGVNGDFRMKVQESTTGTPQLFDANLMYAANTFEDTGTGVSGMTVLIDSMTSHLTEWGSLCFWAEMGPKEDAPHEMTVELGMQDNGYGLADPAHSISLATFTMMEHRTVWFTVDIADIPTATVGTNPFVYIKVTTTPYAQYWIQNAAVSPNISFPGVFFPTSGNPVTYPVSIAYPPEATPAPGNQGPFPLFTPPPGGTVYLAATDQWTRMAVYACPSCADEVLLRRRTPGRRENRMIPPYEERET